MTEHPTRIPIAIEPLSAVVRRAVERCAALGRPVLASYTMRLAADTAPSLANVARYCVWEQPERGFALCAIGEAARIEAHGALRFAEVRERHARLLAEAVVADDEGVAAPVSLAGFSFDPERAADPAWAAFPDALLTLPRLLVARRGADAWLTANLLVDAATDAETEIAALQAEATAVFSRFDPPADAPASFEVRAGEDKESWTASVRELTRQIAGERVAKVVLARRLEVDADAPFDIAATLDRLRQRYPGCTIFAVRAGEACFLGATPELLVRREGETIRTDCLAGSAARGRGAVEDEALGRALLADDKERREHALVTAGIRESLAGLCEAIEIPDAPALRRMANVQHLYTPIEAKVAGERHILEFVERLHPTPAVAGLPRERSLCLIRGQETFSRGWYAAPLGWLDGNGDGEFAVALRSALVQGDRALLYAGCGIVAGSDPEREYDESRIKLEAMLWALSGRS